MGGLVLENECTDSRIGTVDVIKAVASLFHGNPDLVLGFSRFLPTDYSIEYSDSDNPHFLTIRVPPGVNMEANSLDINYLPPVIAESQVGKEIHLRRYAT